MKATEQEIEAEFRALMLREPSMVEVWERAVGDPDEDRGACFLAGCLAASLALHGFEMPKPDDMRRFVQVKLVAAAMLR